MRILCNRESIDDRANVQLSRLYAGNYASVESFIADMKQRHPVIEESGILYHEDDSEESIDQWRLSGHEVHYPSAESRFDAVVILFYEPVRQAIAA